MQEQLESKAGTSDAGRRYHQRANLYVSAGYDAAERLKATLVFYYHPSWRTLSDYFAIGTAQLTAKIDDHFSVQFTFTHFTESRPPQLTKPTDQAYETSFSYKL